MKTKPIKDPVDSFIESVRVGRTSKDKSDLAALMRLRELAHKIAEERLRSSTDFRSEIESLLKTIREVTPLDPKSLQTTKENLQSDLERMAAEARSKDEALRANPISKRIYYKNGKQAKQGDKVINLTTGETGILYSLNEDAPSCNARLARLDSSNMRYVNVIDCVLLDDIMVKPKEQIVGLACSSLYSE